MQGLGYSQLLDWISSQTIPPPTPPPPSPPNIVQQVLLANKGFSKVYNPNDVAISFPDSTRMKAAGTRQLEYWSPTLTKSDYLGTPESRPVGYDNKHIIEVFNPKLRNNPEQLKQAVYGELLHGMSADKGFAQLRQQFINSYSPETAAWLPTLRARGLSDQSIHDMYIRGQLAPDVNNEFTKQKYSARQLEILSKMRKYIAGIQ